MARPQQTAALTDGRPPTVAVSSRLTPAPTRLKTGFTRRDPIRSDRSTSVSIPHPLVDVGNRAIKGAAWAARWGTFRRGIEL